MYGCTGKNKTLAETRNWRYLSQISCADNGGKVTINLNLDKLMKMIQKSGCFQ